MINKENLDRREFMKLLAKDSAALFKKGRRLLVNGVSHKSIARL